MKIRQKILNFIQGWERGSSHEKEWQKLAHGIHRFQLRRNPVYKSWRSLSFIPPPPLLTAHRSPLTFSFLPIVAFKESRVSSFSNFSKNLYFESSGTTAGREGKSRHFLRSLDLYKASVVEGWKWRDQMRSTECGVRSAEYKFRKGRGDFEFHTPHSTLSTFLALMPSFQEKPHSSLSCMLEILMKEFGDGNGFWAMKNGKWDWRGLERRLRKIEREGGASVLFGAAFAWVHFLDWCKVRRKRFDLPPHTLVFETGGVKGRGREVSQVDLHWALARWLGLDLENIRSEYSMCEISSQAWSVSSKSRIIFQFPPWCRPRVVRPGGHPLTSAIASEGEVGVLEILDLANLDSCAFLRTEDMAIRRGVGFELAGRLPKAAWKGCSLEYEN